MTLPSLDGVNCTPDCGVGIGASLDQIAAGGFDVGSRLSQFRAVPCRNELQLRKRIGVPLGAGQRDRFGGERRKLREEQVDRLSLAAGSLGISIALASDPGRSEGIFGSNFFGAWSGATSSYEVCRYLDVSTSTPAPGARRATGARRLSIRGRSCGARRWSSTGRRSRRRGGRGSIRGRRGRRRRSRAGRHGVVRMRNQAGDRPIGTLAGVIQAPA